MEKYMKYLIPLLLVSCVNKPANRPYVYTAEEIAQCIDGCLTVQEMCKAFNSDDDMQCQIDASACIKVCQLKDGGQ
jgi:hypothetical protein